MTAQGLKTFASQARGRMRTEAGYRRDHLHALAQRVDGKRGNTTFAALPRQRAADHVRQLGLPIRLGQQQHAWIEAALMHDGVVGIA